MKGLVISAICLIAAMGCASQRANHARVPIAITGQPETDLTERQRKALKEWALAIKIKNSVADIDRLKDSLNRWDELFMNPAAPDMKPVFAILKGRVEARLAELEAEAASKAK